MVLRLNKSLKLAESIVCLHPHQAAQAQHKLPSLSTVYTALPTCRQQWQTRPRSVALNCHAKRCSPQTAGDLNISNYTILNSFMLHARRMSQFTACPDALNLLSIMNSTQTKIQLKTWMPFPTSNVLKTLQTWTLKDRHHRCCRRKHTPAPAFHWAITLLSHGNVMLRVAFRWSYRTIPTTCLQLVKSANISSVGSRRRAWRHSMTTSWRKNSLLCVSQASQTWMASRSS